MRTIKGFIKWTLDCIKMYINGISEATYTGTNGNYWTCNQTFITGDNILELEKIVDEHDELYNKLLDKLRKKYKDA